MKFNVIGSCFVAYLSSYAYSIIYYRTMLREVCSIFAANLSLALCRLCPIVILCRQCVVKLAVQILLGFRQFIVRVLDAKFVRFCR